MGYLVVSVVSTKPTATLGCPMMVIETVTPAQAGLIIEIVSVGGEADSVGSEKPAATMAWSGSLSAASDVR